MIKKILSISLTLTFLNGCAPINDKFDCPMKGGIYCESIDSVNRKVNRGEINADNIKSRVLLAQPIQYRHANYLASNRGEPLRYGETVMRVWVAPFEDAEGNYHQESDIFTIVKPGHWIGNPLPSIDARGQ